MNDAGRGEAIAERMDALGWGVSELADKAEVSRNAVYRVISGEGTARSSTYAACERALARAEHEAGMDEGAPDAVLSTEHGLVEFEVTGDFGVRVVVKGPVENADELERQVARLIRDIRQDPNDDSGALPPE